MFVFFTKFVVFEKMRNINFIIPLERSYLLLLCGIGYNVVQWSRYELKHDLL